MNVPVVPTDHPSTGSPRPPALMSGGAVRPIIPQDIEQAFRLANAVVKAGMAPPSLETAEKAMVAILHGLEIGLTPMAALQSIAVVNGRPTVYGDGAIALVRASGKCEYIREEVKGDGESMTAVCEVKRKGEERPITGRFSVGDAKRAGLWGKKGPWQQYPRRMMTMRARAFALRDGFADVLRGLGIAEEVQDIPARQAQDQIPQPPATPVKGPPVPPTPPVPPDDEEGEVPDIDPDTGEILDGDPSAGSGEPDQMDDGDFLHKLEDDLAVCMDIETIEEVWTLADPQARFQHNQDMQKLAMMSKKRHLKRVLS